MSKSHERRKATAKQRKALNPTTLDQHFDETLCRVRSEFERTGELHPIFDCLTNRESFDIPVSWSDGSERAAACIALKDCFRRRGVKRYVFTSEAWLNETPDLLSADDSDRGECVQVLAVERNGPRRHAAAEITRNGQRATLGPWQVSRDAPESWLAELLEEGYSDRSPESEPPPLEEISAADFQDLRSQHPDQTVEFQDPFEIHSELSDLIEYELEKHAGGGPVAMFMAMESVLRGIVKDMGSPTRISEFARFLRDHPEAFSMFSTVPDEVPSPQDVRRYKAALQHFYSEKRNAGHLFSSTFGAFINMYMDLGSQAIGALDLADRIENWDPEHQAKLREAGLRSSFELDDEEGSVFIALSVERYPIGIMGRRNTNGDLFVSGLVDFPEPDFDTAVEKIKEAGVDMILGSDAEELLCKMEQLTGTVLRTDKKEIWEVEEWGKDEWLEQAAAELAFAMAMNVQHDVEGNNLNGNVAGYQVRRAQNGLVLVSADGDEDIFVGVKVDKNKQTAQVLGWLRGSEGKIPSFYQKNCWVIPAEALHDIEELPGRERLRAMPPYEEMSS
jgi:hypothetical protein